jgi:hypothetical protein
VDWKFIARCTPSAPALVAHHSLDDALAGKGDLALLAEAVGAVGAELARLASHVDGYQIVYFVVALAAGRHGPSVLSRYRDYTSGRENDTRMDRLGTIAWHTEAGASTPGAAAAAGHLSWPV